MTSVLVPDVGAAIGQTLLGSQGGNFADSTRVPMFFTSTRRLRTLNSQYEREGRSVSITQVIQEEALGPGRGTGKNELPIIKMAVNPNSITWRQPKRIVKRDTREGSVFFHFSNEKGQNNDILVMEFRGNTGNIDFRGDVTVNSGTFSTIRDTPQSNTNAIQKQIIWHNLWALTREQMLLDDNTINTFQIFYSSPIMPILIQLRGFFSNVLEWSDVADRPFSKDYSFTFTVEKVIPPLEDLVALISTTSFDPETEDPGVT